MDVPESDVISHSDVESPLQHDQQPRNHPFSSIGRQSSIYSLTLDEFQHTLCESGKNFGSMNMDEFLTSIWNAEENQATATSNNDHMNNVNSNRGNHHQGGFNDPSATDHRAISKQPSLPRQGSLTLPAPLCRKTVDEVWSEIHREQQQRGQSHSSGGGVGGGGVGGGNMQNSEGAARQPTFGEMTLEDFLIKAGVVREHGINPAPSVLPSQQLQQLYGQSVNNNNPALVSRPVMGIPGGGGSGSVGYPTMVQQGGGGNGGYGPSQGMGVVGQISPVSDTMLNRNADNGGNQYGIDMGGLRGRKRMIDGPVEKVVERRQRRMIKNRESAARSRARKQAYTVELEAELNQLKEENKQLRHALAELERKRKQQYLEDLRLKTQSKAQKAREKLRIMRRNLSCPL